jgi:hypothetical protein
MFKLIYILRFFYFNFKYIYKVVIEIYIVLSLNLL